MKLGVLEQQKLTNKIKELVLAKKLIFAAASNTGGNGSRPWPAKEPGVFCVHAANERGNTSRDMNLTPDAILDNFSTLGLDIASHWNGSDRSISGTSYSTGVAAAISANVLEFARSTLPPEVASHFSIYGTMRRLFRSHMVENSSSSMYHYLKPWRKGLWDGDQSIEEVAAQLEKISIGI